MVEPTTTEVRGSELNYFPIAGGDGPEHGVGKLVTDAFDVYFEAVTVDSYPDPKRADPFSVVYVWSENKGNRSLITSMYVDYGEGERLAEELRG